MAATSTKSLRKNSSAWVAVAIFCGSQLLAPVQAADIFWQTPTTMTADTDVRTNGSLVGAYTLAGFSNPTTVNSVSFTPTNVGVSAPSVAFGSLATLTPVGGSNFVIFGNDSTVSGTPASPTLSSDYAKIASGGGYAFRSDFASATPMTLTLGNLTARRSYMFQTWVNDSRAVVGTRTQTLTGGSNTSGTMAYNSTQGNGGNGSFVVGNFVADSTSQAVAFNLTNSITQMNAFQLRDTTAEWNVTTGLWSDGASWATGTAPANDTTTQAAFFTGSSGRTVQLSANRSIAGVSITNTSSTTIESDGATARQFTLGASGLAVEAGAGAVTVGRVGAPVNVAVTTSSVTNNSSNLLTIGGDVSRASGDATARTLTFAGTGNTTVSGSVSNGGASAALGVTKSGAGTLSLTGGLGFSGGLTVNGGTLAISNNSSSTSVGTFNVGASSGLPRVTVDSGVLRVGTATQSSANIGANAGNRGALTIAGSADVANTTNGSIFSAGNSGAGVVNQTGGAAAWGGGGAFVGWQPNSFGAYLISGGTAAFNSQYAQIGWTGRGLLQQSGGVVTANGPGLIALYGFGIGGGSGFGGANTGMGVADVSGGTLSFTGTTGRFMAVGSLDQAGARGILTVRDSGSVIVTSPDFLITASTTSSATGIVNLIGGSLEVNRIAKTANASARATFNADGGTLRVNASNSGATFLQGLDNAFVYSKGLTVDTNGQSVTIGQALSAPAGYGILASGSTLAVASGGAGYVAPPLVTFAAPAGGGVAATGLATIDANGTVTGITITSAGSGYAANESVAVAFNDGDNTSGAAVTAASGLSATAAQLNASGGLRKTGAGRLTLSAANTYTGATTIAGGTLALGAGGSFANSSSIIVGNAGSSGAMLDLSAKTGSFDIGAGQTLGGGGTVQLASAGTLNVLGLLSPGNSPGLLTFDAGTTLLAGTTLMEIWGTSRATDPSHGDGFYDAINVVNNGVLTFGGLLELTFDQLFADNSTFNLFSSLSGGSLSGNFSGVNVTGSVYNGLTWSQSGTKWTSSATTGGQSLEFNATSGALVIVPEPGALALAGIGVAAAAWAARRRRS